MEFFPIFETKNLSNTFCGRNGHSNIGFQNPAVSCSDNKKKLLCLPFDYSKFDLPYRNEYNVIDIGESLPNSMGQAMAA
jgi:hypothetical protein